MVALVHLSSHVCKIWYFSRSSMTIRSIGNLLLSAPEGSSLGKCGIFDFFFSVLNDQCRRNVIT